jgi:hypothetical protein
MCTNSIFKSKSFTGLETNANIFFSILISLKNLGDGFLKMAITLLSDFPKQIELDGKPVLSEKYLYESITNIMSTLVVVPVCF